MTKRMTLAGIMVGALAMPALAQRISSSAASDRGPDPAMITRVSVQRIHRVTMRTVRIMHGQAHRCSVAITHLLENEDPDRAAELAGQCIAAINEVAARGHEMVGNIAERGVQILTNLEAPAPMIEAVRNAAQAASDTIQEHRDAAVQTVEDALAG